jgi:hypothetical protein
LSALDRRDAERDPSAYRLVTVGLQRWDEAFEPSAEAVLLRHSQNRFARHACARRAAQKC